MTLLKETIETLRSEGKSLEDIDYICLDMVILTTPIEELFNVRYDSGYGCAEIPTGLRVVGKDWWLERGEYDGSEWWEFKSLPEKPSVFSRSPLTKCWD